MTAITSRLLHRSDSYMRDSAVLRADGDLHSAVMFATIADELRGLAGEFGAITDGDGGEG